MNHRYPAMALACLILTTLISIGQANAAQSIHDIISAAIANPARPDSDRNQDANRKSLEVLTFA